MLDQLGAMEGSGVWSDRHPPTGMTRIHARGLELIPVQHGEWMVRVDWVASVHAPMLRQWQGVVINNSEDWRVFLRFLRWIWLGYPGDLTH